MHVLIYLFFIIILIVSESCMYSTPGSAGLLRSREGHRPRIEQGRRPCRVRPQRVRVQICRYVRAVEQVNCVVLRHSTQRAGRGRVVVRIDMVKVGKEEGGFVCSELSKKSSGLSW